ncbi:hypothetical protein IAT38_006879 [Cryptococcus sp. DSM 104549]
MSSIEDMAREKITANLGKELGPLLLAMGCDAVLMGMIINQFVRYFFSTKKESAHIKAIVYFATFATLATTVYTWAWEMHIFAFSYAQYAQFVSQRWTSWYSILCSCTKISVQTFYAERAWRINGCKNILLVVLAIFLILSAVGSFAFTFLTFHINDDVIPKTAQIFYHLWAHAHAMPEPHRSPPSCIVSDLITTSSILYGLHRSRTGWAHTDQLITKLARVSLEAQIPPTIFATIVLMCWSKQVTSIAQLFVIILPKIYLTGCLGVLNSRESIRLGGSSSYNTSSNFHSSRQSTRLQQATVTVETDTYVERSPATTLPAVGINRQHQLDAKESVEDLESGV